MLDAIRIFRFGDGLSNWPVPPQSASNFEYWKAQKCTLMCFNCTSLKHNTNDSNWHRIYTNSWPKTKVCTAQAHTIIPLKWIANSINCDIGWSIQKTWCLKNLTLNIVSFCVIPMLNITFWNVRPPTWYGALHWNEFRLSGRRNENRQRMIHVKGELNKYCKVARVFRSNFRNEIFQNLFAHSEYVCERGGERG